MLGTDLKPAARFKAVQTYLKPSGRLRSHPDGFRAVQTASKPSVRTNMVTKLSSKPAARPSLPVEYDVVHDPSHSDLCRAIKEGSATNTTQASLMLPLLPAVSRCLEEGFPTARKK